MNIQDSVIPTCLIHLGDQPPPAYYRHSLEQLRLFTQGRIILVTECLDDWQQVLLERLSIDWIKPSSLQLSESHVQFLSSQNLDKSFREGFWTYVVERFFVLEEVMVFLPTRRIFHIEGDNLVFHDVSDLDAKLKNHYPGIAVPFDHDQRAIAGVFFVFCRKALSAFNRFVVEMFKANPGVHITDMQLLGLFRDALPQHIDSLPVVPKNYQGDFKNLRGEVSKFPDLFARHQDKIDLIFDACALGQYVAGLDPRNAKTANDKPFINETAMQKYDHFDFSFDLDERDGLRKPWLKTNAGITKVANLHIHSKNLFRFKSPDFVQIPKATPTINTFSDIPSWEIITSERIQQLADLCITDKFTFASYTRFGAVPRINFLVVDGSRSRLEPTAQDLREIDRAMILFVNTHILLSFQEHILPHLFEPFVLISHASDDSVDEKFLPMLADPRLIHWFAQNVTISHEKLTALPIGIANRQFVHGDLDALRAQMESGTTKRLALFTCLSQNTNSDRLRKTESLLRNGFQVTPNRLDYRSYLRAMSEHLFVASPQGNGIDCHRTWEALYLGSIPLVDKGKWLEHFPELGIVGVSDWDEVTTSFLSTHIKKHVSRDFSKLTLSFWINSIYALKYSRS